MGRTDRETARGPWRNPLLVDRGAFDLRLPARVAVRVGDRKTGSLLEHEWDGAKWRLAIDAGGVSKQLDADFVADATGRHSISPGRRATRKPVLSCRFASALCGASPAEIRSVTEAGDDAWYWGSPVAYGTYNTLVFVDPPFRIAGAFSMKELLSQ